MHFILSMVLLFSALSTTDSDSLKIKLLKHELNAELRKEMNDSFREIKSDLDKRFETAKDDFNNQKKDFAIYAILANVILLGAGISIILAVRRNAINKLNKIIDNALYRVDPISMPIKIPKKQMDYEYQRLKRLGFTDVKDYQFYDDSCTHGAVILFCDNDETANKARQFIQDRNLKDRDDVIFIVYTKGPRIDPAIFRDFVNVTFANNPLTLVQALFVARRGMVG